MRLIDVLPCPTSPMEVTASDTWTDVEVSLRQNLPSDFKEFVRSYGTGCIDNFLWVFNPFSANPHLNLLHQLEPRLNAEREIRDKFPHLVPFALFPERGGLLPFGASDNGDVLFWLTEGVPDQWAVVVCESRGDEYSRFNCTMTEFLAGILNRTLKCEVFPNDFPSLRPQFEPRVFP